MKKVVKCIICPKACNITVYENKKGELVVEKEGCKRGAEYAIEEYKNPKRVLTTTVKMSIDGRSGFLPVKTEKMVPKDSLCSYMIELAKVVVKKKVRKGEKVYTDIGGTGVDVIACTDAEMILNYF
jgi:CxxC motif-containing protein